MGRSPKSFTLSPSIQLPPLYPPETERPLQLVFVSPRGLLLRVCAEAETMLLATVLQVMPQDPGSVSTCHVQVQGG